MADDNNFSLVKKTRLCKKLQYCIYYVTKLVKRCMHNSLPSMENPGYFFKYCSLNLIEFLTINGFNIIATMISNDNMSFQHIQVG